MNVLKIALLGTAALAAVSVSARADDLSDLKAQIEALNGRIASLESAPAVPAGYQLLSISETNTVILPGSESDKFFGATGTKIGIMPTADVPASTTVVWTGFVSAAVTYRDDNFVGINDAVDIKSKAGLNVTGTTDTAVGEVGVSVTLLADARTGTGVSNRGHSGVGTDGFRGWWKITPELELSGGVFGTAGNTSSGWDGKCRCYYVGTDGGYGTFMGNDTAQIRLSYASGPISFAIAIEDSDELGVNNDGFGTAAELKYAGDTIGFELNAGYWQTTGDEDWTVNAGANFALGDMLNLSLTAGVGEDQGFAGNGDGYWKVSAFTSFNLSDAVSLELGAGYKNYKNDLAFTDYVGVGGGLYYTPVSQLTLGLEGSYIDRKSAANDVRAALVTIYRF